MLDTVPDPALSQHLWHFNPYSAEILFIINQAYVMINDFPQIPRSDLSFLYSPMYNYTNCPEKLTVLIHHKLCINIPLTVLSLKVMKDAKYYTYRKHEFPWSRSCKHYGKSYCRQNITMMLSNDNTKYHNFIQHIWNNLQNLLMTFLALWTSLKLMYVTWIQLTILFSKRSVAQCTEKPSVFNTFKVKFPESFP